MRYRILFFMTVLLGTSAKSQTCTVSDVQIEEYRTPKHPSDLKKIHYTYSCEPTSARIVISGLGEVSSVGTFSYLTEDRVITLSQAGSASQPLASIPIVPNGVSGDATRPEIPLSSDFPEQSVPGKWQGHDFVTDVGSIVDRRFGSHEVLEAAGTRKFISSYHLLPDLPQNVLAEIAVEIIYSAATGQFELHTVCQESRSKSAVWKPAQTQAVLDAAQAYSDAVFRQIQGASK